MYNFVAKQKLLYETLQVSLFPVPPFLYQSTLLVINRWDMYVGYSSELTDSVQNKLWNSKTLYTSTRQ